MKHHWRSCPTLTTALSFFPGELIYSLFSTWCLLWSVKSWVVKSWVSSLKLFSFFLEKLCLFPLWRSQFDLLVWTEDSFYYLWKGQINSRIEYHLQLEPQILYTESLFSVKKYRVISTHSTLSNCAQVFFFSHHPQWTYVPYVSQPKEVRSRKTMGDN